MRWVQYSRCVLDFDVRIVMLAWSISFHSTESIVYNFVSKLPQP